MIRDPAPLSLSDRALDGFVTGIANGLLVVGLLGVAAVLWAAFDLAAWLVEMPPMPGRGW